MIKKVFSNNRWHFSRRVKINLLMGSLWILLVTFIFVLTHRIDIYDWLLTNSSQIAYIRVTTDDPLDFRQTIQVAITSDEKTIQNVLNYIKDHLDGWDKVDRGGTPSTGYYINFYLKNEKERYTYLFLGSKFLYRDFGKYYYSKNISAEEVATLKNILQLK